MKLLELFDGPSSAGGRHAAQSDEVAPGYSQVKVTATTSKRHSSTVNGQLSQEPNGTVSALIQSKKDSRYGLNPANHYLYVDGNVDESAGGGTVSHTNYVSTVNIGGSSQHPQPKEQQQQQHGSSVSATKLSTASVAMTSAVTSVSTMKTRPQQSSTTSSSSDAVS